MMIRVFEMVLLLVLLVGSEAFAANHYIRDGGSASTSGTGSCTTWETANACDGLPTTLVRGDTYYIADGSYAARTFSTAASGTTTITIKKATTSDHGTDTGWVSTYGDGQAEFASPLSFTTSYWVLDGAVRDESNAPLSWFTSSAYGFKISNNANAARVQIDATAARIDSLTVKYTWVQGRSGAYSGGEHRYAVDVEFDENNRSANLLFQRNLFTDSNQHLFLRTTQDAIAEYNAHDNLSGDGTNHGNTINCYWHCEGLIVRFSVFRNIGEGSGYSGVTQVIAIAERNDGGNGVRPTYWAYGNLTYRTSGADGVFGYGTTSATSNADCLNCREYNNTIVDGNMQYNNPWGLQHGTGSGNIAQNNLFFDGTNSSLSSSPAQSDLGSGGTFSYNAYGPGSGTEGTNAQGSLTSAIFMSYATDNYALASATTCGTTITGTAPDGGRLDVDMLGHTRGADGCWDRGAFEYSSSTWSVITGGTSFSGKVTIQ